MAHAEHHHWLLWVSASRLAWSGQIVCPAVKQSHIQFLFKRSGVTAVARGPKILQALPGNPAEGKVSVICLDDPLHSAALASAR